MSTPGKPDRRAAGARCPPPSPRPQLPKALREIAVRSANMMERSELGRSTVDRNQAGQEGPGGAPSLSKRLPVSLFQECWRMGRMVWPRPPPRIQSLEQNGPLPEKCGVPTSTSRGRGGGGIATGRGWKGPELPTPAVPCSQKDSCNPLCRGKTAAKFIVTGLLPMLRGQGLPQSASITLGLQPVH